jgi:hypothetical protein
MPTFRNTLFHLHGRVGVCRTHTYSPLLLSRFQTFAVCWMLYYFFWVIPRRLSFKCRRFGTLCLFHLYGCRTHTYSPVKMEQTERSETSAFETQTPGNYPKEIIQHFHFLQVLPPVWNNSGPSGQIFMKFDIWVRFENQFRQSFIKIWQD